MRRVIMFLILFKGVLQEITQLSGGGVGNERVPLSQAACVFGYPQDFFDNRQAGNGQNSEGKSSLGG